MLKLTSAMFSMSMGRDPASRHHMWVGYALLLMVVVTSVKEVLQAKPVQSIVAYLGLLVCWLRYLTYLA